jgi:hypothetical protein
MVLIGVFVDAIAASGYRYYLDYHQLEYYRDLEDPGWRNR